MKLVLNIYTDDSLVEIKRVAEADRLKIPYRVALTVAQSLDSIDINSQDDLVNFLGHNLDKVDKIIKATFGVSELEMECIDLMEMGNVALEVYKWALDKINSLKGGNDSKNE